MEKIVFSILIAITVLTIVSLPFETFGQTIKITKNATNADGVFDFTIFNATNPSNSTAVSIPNTAISNMTTPLSVIPGNYSVTETVPSGWILDASDCEINSISQGTTLNFNVTIGDSVECIFENTMEEDILEAILTEVTNIEEKLDGDRPSLITDIVTSLTTLQSDITQIFNLLTDPTFGLEEIKNEIRIIEGNVTSPEFGLQEIKSEIMDIENTLNNLNSTGIIFVTVSDNFAATAGSTSESVLATLNSTKYPIVVRTVYFNATTGTGTADLSAGERIRYDSLRVDGGLVNDPGTLQLMVSGANTVDKEQRILQVEAGNANLHRLFPFGINGDMLMAINLDSKAGAAVNDGFEFSVIVIVEAPSDATVTLDVQ